jgi:hypothetical protein
MMPPDEVAFDSDVYLLTSAKAKALKLRVENPIELNSDGATGPLIESARSPIQDSAVATSAEKQQVRIIGVIPPEVWNRLGTKLIPKLKSGINLKLGLNLTLEVDGVATPQLISDLKQAIEDLELTEVLKVERE